MSKLSGHRILLVAGHYCPLVGGAQAVYDALARELPDTIQILTSKRDYMTGKYVEGADAFDAAAPYKITRIDRMRPDMALKKGGFFARLQQQWQSIRVCKHIVQTIELLHEDSSFDTIIIGASDAMTWLPSALKKSHRFNNVKLVFYTHGEEVSQRASSTMLAAKRMEALRLCDLIIAVSNFTVNVLTERYMVNPDKIALVPNGVKFAEYSRRKTSSAPAPSGAGKQVIGVGRLVARKGFDALVRVWPRVIESEPTARLVIVGEGPEAEYLHSQIANMQLDASVQLRAEVSKSELIETLQSSDLFVMPNRTLADGDTEGFGLVFLEAAASRLASIGGAFGGATDAILHEKTGLLIDSKNDDALLAAITQLLSDYQLRKTMADAAYDHAQSNDWSYKALEFISAIQQMHASSSRGQRA